MAGFTEAHRDHISKLNALNAKRSAETKERNIKAISEYLMNLTGGAAVKEICVDTHFSSELVRRVLKELVESGDVVVLGKEGKSVLYGWHKGEAKPTTKEEADALMPVSIGGKEFETVKPAIHVNQGELIWCSSRSGDGAFFLYLVLSPWEKKATVIGTFPEGHPCLNINDNRNVYLGEYEGVKRYANLDNVCSRAYAQFGESIGFVPEETMLELKERIRRYYRIPSGGSEAEEVAALKKRISFAERDRDTKVNGMQAIVDKLSDELTAKVNKINELDAFCEEVVKNSTELELANDELQQKLKNAYLECDEKKKDWEDMHKLAQDALAEIDKATKTINEQTDQIKELEKQKKDLGIQLDQMGKDLVDLEAENDKLKKQLEDQEEPHAESPVNADDLLYYIAQLECRIEGKDALIAQQKETISMLKGFVEGRSWKG